MKKICYNWGMKKQDVYDFALNHYAVTPDYPWADEKYKDAAVLRHINNRKWFGLVMDVNGGLIGRNPDRKYEVMNVKAEPEMIASLCEQKGVIPAYHMNKMHWISLILEEIEPGLLYSLLDKSYELTDSIKRYGKI